MNIRIEASFYFILGIIFVAGIVEHKALGSEQLTAAQMDAVTAGAITVGLEAYSAGVGDPLQVTAKTNTIAFSNKSGSLQAGFGYGTAAACCGPDTEAKVSTQASADGNSTFLVNREFSYSSSSCHYGEFSSAYGEAIAISIGPSYP